MLLTQKQATELSVSILDAFVEGRIDAEGAAGRLGVIRGYLDLKDQAEEDLLELNRREAEAAILTRIQNQILKTPRVYGNPGQEYIDLTLLYISDLLQNEFRPLRDPDNGDLYIIDQDGQEHRAIETIFERLGNMMVLQEVGAKPGVG